MSKLKPDEVLLDAKAFARKVYAMTPPKFGWFAETDVLQMLIEVMIARGYMEGFNAARRK